MRFTNVRISAGMVSVFREPYFQLGLQATDGGSDLFVRFDHTSVSVPSRLRAWWLANELDRLALGTHPTPYLRLTYPSTISLNSAPIPAPLSVIAFFPSMNTGAAGLSPVPGSASPMAAC